MAFELVTGRAGHGHVTSDDVGVMNALLFGDGRYVLDELHAEVVDSNTVHLDGFNALIDGRHFRCSSEGLELKISNGAQNRNRRDLVVIRYELEVSGGDFVECGSIVVLEGEQVMGDAQAPEPEHANGSILAGDRLVEVPLFAIDLHGTEVILDDNYRIGPYALPVALGGTGTMSLMGSSGLMHDIFDESKVDYQYVPVFNESWGDGGFMTVQNLRNKMGLGNTVGALPVANGGTGVTSLQALRKAAGLGDTVGALPVANGGTGVTSLQALRKAAGLGDTVGALPVANGGTGATAGATALSNLGAKDFIVASGKSGIWEYAKWNSGLAICAATKTFTVTTSLWNWNVGTPGMSFGAFPFTFAQIYYVNCNPTNRNDMWGYVQQFNNKEITHAYCAGFYYIGSQSLSLDVRVIAVGTWK